MECTLFNDEAMKFSGTNHPTKNISKRELFGFLFHNPVSRASGVGYFNAVAIFTPVGTAFSAEAPK